jgi:Flagellar hook-length control protein
MTLQLNPRALGRITVSLSAKDGGVDVKMATQSHATAALLADGEGRLSQALDAQGLRMTGFQASMGSGERQSNHQGEGGHHSDQQKQRNAPQTGDLRVESDIDDAEIGSANNNLVNLLA